MITSLSNPQVKAIRKLREKKYRQETGSYFIEGAKLVGECIEEEWEIEMVVFSKDLIQQNYGRIILQETTKLGMTILEVSPEVFSHYPTRMVHRVSGLS